MNKRKASNFSNYSRLLLIILIFSSIQEISSKISRRHKHPGSSNSGGSNIEIEPLNKKDLNEDNNLNSQNYEDNTNKKVYSQKVINQNIQDNSNKKYNQDYINEDDEFVYGFNNQPPQNKEIKDDSLLDLDKELQKREENQNKKQINNNEKMQNNQFEDKEKEKKMREQREQREQRKRQQQNRYNPNPGRERIVRPENLNHGRGYPGDVNKRPPNHQSYDPQTTKTTPPSKTKKIMSLVYQIMMIFFCISFVFNFFLGKSQNDKHALVWYNSNKEYFEERYEYIGVEEEDELKKPKKNKLSLIKNCKLIKENPYYYKLTCANYRYIRYLTVVLEFHKRYDMTSLLSSIFISPRDRIVFQVSFEPVDNVGWIFCVSKKKQSNSLKKSYEDLNYFCETYEPSSFNNYMCLLSESLEMFMELFNNKSLFHYYKSIEKYLEAIYYSDMIGMYVEGNNIFFSFNIDLTKPNQDRDLLEITHFVNLFVDTLAQLKYSKQFKDKVKNSRIMFERTKMDANKRKEIEEKEKRDFIEKWKIKNKMRTKKGAERRKLERELGKYQ